MISFMESNKMKELVSVLITNYSNKRYIKEYFMSIRKQTYKNISFIGLETLGRYFTNGEYIDVRW